MRRRLAILALGCVVCLIAVSQAAAAGLSGPVADCQTHGGQLTRHWSADQLKNALTTMPADIREYSDCYDVVQKALLDEIHGLNDGGSSGGGGSFLPVWLIVVLALLLLGGAGLGVVALRNRNSGS